MAEPTSELGRYNEQMTTLLNQVFSDPADQQQIRPMGPRQRHYPPTEMGRYFQQRELTHRQNFRNGSPAGATSQPGFQQAEDEDVARQLQNDRQTMMNQAMSGAQRGSSTPVTGDNGEVINMFAGMLGLEGQLGGMVTRFLPRIPFVGKSISALVMVASSFVGRLFDKNAPRVGFSDAFRALDDAHRHGGMAQALASMGINQEAMLRDLNGVSNPGGAGGAAAGPRAIEDSLRSDIPSISQAIAGLNVGGVPVPEVSALTAFLADPNNAAAISGPNMRYMLVTLPNDGGTAIAVGTVNPEGTQMTPTQMIRVVNGVAVPEPVTNPTPIAVARRPGPLDGVQVVDGTLVNTQEELRADILTRANTPGTQPATIQLAAKMRELHLKTAGSFALPADMQHMLVVRNGVPSIVSGRIDPLTNTMMPMAVTSVENNAARTVMLPENPPQTRIAVTPSLSRGALVPNASSPTVTGLLGTLRGDDPAVSRLRDALGANGAAGALDDQLRGQNGVVMHHVAMRLPGGGVELVSGSLVGNNFTPIFRTSVGTNGLNPSVPAGPSRTIQLTGITPAPVPTPVPVPAPDLATQTPTSREALMFESITLEANKRYTITVRADDTRPAAIITGYRNNANQFVVQSTQLADGNNPANWTAVQNVPAPGLIIPLTAVAPDAPLKLNIQQLYNQSRQAGLRAMRSANPTAGVELQLGTVTRTGDAVVITAQAGENSREATTMAGTVSGNTLTITTVTVAGRPVTLSPANPITIDLSAVGGTQEELTNNMGTLQESLNADTNLQNALRTFGNGSTPGNPVLAGNIGNLTPNINFGEILSMAGRTFS